MKASTLCRQTKASCGVARLVPRARVTASRVHQPFRNSIQCAAEGYNVRNMRMELNDLQEEISNVADLARQQQKKKNGIITAVSQMDQLALRCIENGDEERARSIIEEKSSIMQQADIASEKIQTFLKLENKLQEAMSLKRAALLQAQGDEGTTFEDSSAQVRIVIGDDGKPRFERTGPLGEIPTFSSRNGQDQQNRYNSKEEERPSWGPASDRAAYEYGTQDVDYSSRLQEAYSGMEYMSIEDLLNESDRKLEDKFVEIERQQLERRLKASDYSSPSYPSIEPPQPARSYYPPPAPRYSNMSSPWDDPQPSAPAQPPISNSSSAPVDPWGSRSAEPTESRAVVAEWWTAGQNALMDGALATLKENYQPLYADAGKALVAVTNARVRGQAPTQAQILSLVALTLVSPEQHGTSTFWGVDQPPGAKQMPENIKIAIFGTALQYLIEDLLTGSATMLSSDKSAQSSQAKAILVTLASALQLRTTEASDYSVKLILRTLRAAMMNSLGPMRLANRSDNQDPMDQAERDLRALHNLLKTLPCSLPIAVGHIAAREVTEQLRRIMTSEDARRMDNLYSVVCRGDYTSTTVRAILGPLYGDKY